MRASAGEEKFTLGETFGFGPGHALPSSFQPAARSRQLAVIIIQAWVAAAEQATAAEEVDS